MPLRGFIVILNEMKDSGLNEPFASLSEIPRYAQNDMLNTTRVY